MSRICKWNKKRNACEGRSGSVCRVKKVPGGSRPENWLAQLTDRGRAVASVYTSSVTKARSVCGALVRARQQGVLLGRLAR